MSLPSKDLPRKSYVQDEDEEELESFLFCSNQNLLLKPNDAEKTKSYVDAETNQSSSDEEDTGELLSFCISTNPGLEELQSDVAEEICHPPVTKLRQGKVRKAAWCDVDDEQVSVDLKAVPLLKKLRKTIDEEIIDGNKFQERLKSQFEKVVGAPAWADLDSIQRTTAYSETDDDHDHDNDTEAIFKTSRNLLGTSTSLPKSVLNIQRSKDLNFCFRPDTGVKCVEFHPTAKIALTAGLSKRLDLFQVDGSENPKIQSIFLEKFPVHTAHFCGSGDKVYLAARHPFYYCYDLIGGEVLKIPLTIGKVMQRCSRFVISPDSGILAFLGDNGYLNLVSAKSHQFIASLKMNGSIEAAAFSSEASKVYTTGGDGEVYLWDIGTRRCIHKFTDDGSLKSTCIDVSPDGIHLAVGSSSGVVNVYDEACLSKRRPSPVKTVLNLTTHIKTVKFNSTSEMLAISSPVVKDALKLMHIPSMTVFSNWPRQTTPLGYVECLDFSPRSGYLAIGNTKGKALLYRHDVREELEKGEVEDMADRVQSSLTATDEVSSDCDDSQGLVRGSRDEPETLTYSDYLKVEDLLRCCQPVTDVHDEHLFIIVHQVYELWFKEILHELDSVRGLFQQPKVDERDMLKVNSRLSRVVNILKILVDQIMILETMNPSDFGQFRDKLKNSSGFQSVQFRLLENKLGTSKGSRIRYNNVDYSMTFKDMPKYRRMIEESEKQPSVFDLVQMWLERTPGLETDGFNFWEKYRVSCRRWLEDEKLNIEKIQDLNQRSNKLEALKKNQENFDQILIEENYERSRMRGDRRFSWKAIQGALMISFYCDEVVFHQPFRMLTLLMDIDSLITKWRYNHVMLVQRQLGTKLGSGGSSGYQYLRSTVSDRYKVFLDLFNLSNYLIPKQYITPLSRQYRSRLITVCMPSFVDLEGADSGGEYTVSDSK